MATDAASILSMALQVLSAKLILILALAMASALWCWAMWAHSWVALAIAASFAILVFLPILYRRDSRAENRP